MIIFRYDVDRAGQVLSKNPLHYIIPSTLSFSLIHSSPLSSSSCESHSLAILHHTLHTSQLESKKLNKVPHITSCIQQVVGLRAAIRRPSLGAHPLIPPGWCRWTSESKLVFLSYLAPRLALRAVPPLCRHNCHWLLDYQLQQYYAVTSQKLITSIYTGSFRSRVLMTSMLSLSAPEISCLVCFSSDLSPR